LTGRGEVRHLSHRAAEGRLFRGVRQRSAAGVGIAAEAGRRPRGGVSIVGVQAHDIHEGVAAIEQGEHVEVQLRLAQPRELLAFLFAYMGFDQPPQTLHGIDIISGIRRTRLHVADGLLGCGVLRFDSVYETRIAQCRTGGRVKQCLFDLRVNAK
jgi:hypothetical protein